MTLREIRYGQVAEILADGYTGGAPFTDLEVGYKITPQLTLAIGADNLSDKTAGHAAAEARYQNAEQYILTSPYGIDGGFYYGRVAYNF